MVAPAAGIRGEVLNRHENLERPAHKGNVLAMNMPRPSAGPVMGNYPVGVAQQAQGGGRVAFRAAPLPAPQQAVRAQPAVVLPATNPHVPYAGRGLPGGVVPTTPVILAPNPQPAVIVANQNHRRFHVPAITNTWTPVVSFALAVLGIGVLASVLAPEAALIIFPAALLLAISSVAIKALIGK